MILGPDDYIAKLWNKFGDLLGKTERPLNFEPPISMARANPFEGACDIDDYAERATDRPFNLLPLASLKQSANSRSTDQAVSTKTTEKVINNNSTQKDVNNNNNEITSIAKSAPASAGVISNATPIPSSVESINSSSKAKPSIQNVRASDYITPQKYLDGAEIPSFYSFQSNMIPPEDLKHGMVPFHEVDRRLTLPTRTHIRLLVTATDVLHCWACPSLNLKADALPARVTRMNTFILREGVFYGQCSEFCGSLHGYMPIVVEAVSPEAFAAHARKFYHD